VELTRDPLFILAPPRSFSSLVCGMLGQHPEMYGLPETHLLASETIREWQDLCMQSTFPMADGLLRAVAELYFGSQTESTIVPAQGWLRRRSHLTTGMVLELLAGKVAPRVIIEKSPSLVYRLDSLQRAHSMFPQARFLHLLRHPRGQCESVVKFIEKTSHSGASPHWLIQLGALTASPAAADPHQQADPEWDPQNGWYRLQMNICAFFDSLPAEQKMRIRAEDLLANPDEILPQIAAWMGLRTDAGAVDQMKHPERSPYTAWGPPNARGGNDPDFLASPAIVPARIGRHHLSGPLPWRKDSAGFSPPVRQLARSFGYL
jgi:Sulfotransferase family